MDKAKLSDKILRAALVIAAVGVAIFILSVAIGFAIWTWLIFGQAFG